MYDVDDLKANLVENVRSVAVRQIGLMRMNGRPRTCILWWNDDVKDAGKE